MSDTSRTELLKSLPRDLQVEIIENMFRKDLTESEKASVQNILRKYFTIHTKQGRRTDLERNPADNSDDLKKLNVLKNQSNAKSATSSNMLDKVGRTDEKIAKIMGESDENVRRRDRVFETIDENTRKDLDSGQKSLNSAYQNTVSEQNRSIKIPPLPKGKFNHIVEDPGWHFKNQNIGGSGQSGASHKYRTQPTMDIAKIPVADIAADDAILYMWTTNQHLLTGSMLLSEYYEIVNNQKLKIACKKTKNKDKIAKLEKQFLADNQLLSEILANQKVQSDALSVMHCHGFTPKNIITWHKENKKGWGGYSFNNVTEHLIIGTRGTVKPFGLSEETIVSTQWSKSHSTKPEEMWQLIEKCVKTQRWKSRKLELNCRTPRDGWLPHGDEITTKDIDEWKK